MLQHSQPRHLILMYLSPNVGGFIARLDFRGARLPAPVPQISLPVSMGRARASFRCRALPGSILQGERHTIGSSNPGPLPNDEFARPGTMVSAHCPGSESNIIKAVSSCLQI
jgi:hypothetical protein